MRKIKNWIVPTVGLVVFASGVFNIISAVSFASRLRLRFLETFLPWPVLSTSRSLTLLFGAFLIFLAGGLWQRKRRAMQLSLVVLVLSFVFHLTKGLDFEEALVLLIPINLLVIFRGEFRVESSVPRFLTALRNTVLILVFLFLYAVFGYYLFQGQFRQKVTLANIGHDYEYSISGLGRDTLIPVTRRALWFEESISVVGAAALFLALGNLFAPVFLHNRPSKEDWDWVRQLIDHFGDNSVDYFALLSDKSYFFTQSRRCFIAYKVVGGMAVVLGGPIGVKEEKALCLSDFRAEMTKRGLGVVIYQLDEEGRALAEKIDMNVMKFGEQAVIKVDGFSLEGAKMAEVRHCVSRVEKEKVEFRMDSFATVPWRVTADVDDLHGRWLARKRIPPLTFASDFYPLPIEADAYLLTARSVQGKLLAALSFLPYKAGRGEVLDLMLRDAEAFNGLVEGAIVYAVNYFKKIGKEEVSLSLAPLADVGQEGGANLVAKSTRLIFRRFSRLYRFQPLFSFKQKFNPVWEHVYVAFERKIDLPKVAVALLRANLKVRV